MKKPITYISGKITGIDEKEAYNAFMNACAKLNHYGYPHANPMFLCKSHWSWTRCMIKCVWHLITRCSNIYLMENWKESRGARIEVMIAILFKKRIITLKDLVYKKCEHLHEIELHNETLRECKATGERHPKCSACFHV